MTDKELLEDAAKAAGIRFNHQGQPTTGNFYDESDFVWNPLTDDGDALRLAVKLELVLEVWNDMVYAYDGSTFNIEEPITPTVDPYAATRRAIVRAAAEIGKAK